MERLANSLRRALRQARLMRRSIIAVTLIVPVSVGALRIAEVGDGPVGTTVTIGLLLVGLICGILLLFGSNDAVDVADDLLEALDKNRQLTRRGKGLARAVDQASTRHGFLQSLETLVESVGHPPERASITTFNTNAFDVLVALHDSLFEIRSGEHWGYAVYLRSADSSALNCLAWKRAWRERPGYAPRNWSAGRGHVGVAFARAGELVYPDAALPEIARLVDPGGLTSVNDPRYRSVACVPIVTGKSTGKAKPFGVVVATSNRKGRFKPDENAELEPLRDLARWNAKLMEKATALWQGLPMSKSKSQATKTVRSEIEIDRDESDKLADRMIKAVESASRAQIQKLARERAKLLSSRALREVG